MKNFKRILALVLAVMMVATSVVAISAAEADEKVVYSTEAITRIGPEKLGILQGYNLENMGADDNVTRAQMALFTGRVLTGNIESDYWESYRKLETMTFEDIDDIAEYYIGAITYAYENGVIVGKSDTCFDPDGNVTYQEALTMVVRSLGYTGLSYPNGYINKAMKLGLTKDIANLDYKDVAVRGVVATILYNALYADDSLFADNFGLTSGTYMLVATPTVVKASGLKIPGASINGYVGKELNEGYVAFAPIGEDNRAVNSASKYVYARVSQIADDLKGNFVDEHYADKLGYAFNLTFENNVLTWGDECYSEVFTNYGDKIEITATNIDFDHITVAEYNRLNEDAQKEYTAIPNKTNPAYYQKAEAFLTFGNQAYNLVGATKADYNSPTTTQDIILYADYGMDEQAVYDYIQLFKNNDIVDKDGNVLLKWNDALKAYFKKAPGSNDYNIKATSEDLFAALTKFDYTLYSDYATIKGGDVIADIYDYKLKDGEDKKNDILGTSYNNFNYAVAIAANYFCQIVAMDYNDDGFYDAAIYTPYYLGAVNEVKDHDSNSKDGKEFTLSGITNAAGTANLLSGSGVTMPNVNDYTFTGDTNGGKAPESWHWYLYTYNRLTNEINIKEEAKPVEGKVKWGVKGAVAPDSLIYEDSQVSIGDTVYQVGGWYYNNLYGLKGVANFDAKERNAISKAMGVEATSTYYNGWNDVLDFGMTDACSGFKGYYLAGHLIHGVPLLDTSKTEYPYVIFNAYQSEFAIENDQIVVNNVILDDSGKYNEIKISSVDSNEFTEIEWQVFEQYIKRLYGEAANINIYLSYYFNDARREYHKTTDLYKAIEREFIIDRLTSNLVDFNENDYAELSSDDKKVTLIYAVEGKNDDGSYRLFFKDYEETTLVMDKIKGADEASNAALKFDRGITAYGDKLYRTNANTVFTFVAKDGIYTYAGMPLDGYQINLYAGTSYIFSMSADKFMIVDRDHCIDEIAVVVARDYGMCTLCNNNYVHSCKSGIYWSEKVQDVALEYVTHDDQCIEKTLSIDPVTKAENWDNPNRCDYLVRVHEDTWAFVEYVPYIEATFEYDKVYMVTADTANVKIEAVEGELYYTYSNLYNLVDNKMEDVVVFKGADPAVFKDLNGALDSLVYENGGYVVGNKPNDVDTNVGMFIVCDPDIVNESAYDVDFKWMSFANAADVFNITDEFGHATELKTGTYVGAQYDTGKKLTYVEISGASNPYYVEGVDFVTFTQVKNAAGKVTGVKVGTFADIAKGATVFYTYNATTATLTGYAFN